MRKLLLSALIMLTAASSMSAQELSSAYFLDHFAYSYRFNPAAKPENRVYVGLAVPNVNAGLNTNLDASKVFQPFDGHLVFGTDPKIPAEKFLSALKTDNRIMAGVNENILSFGWRKKNQDYVAVELNAKAMAGAAIPYSFFEFMKSADFGHSYDISNFTVNGSAYIELAVNYTRNVSDNFRFGFAVKPLIGLANIKGDISSVKVDITPEGVATYKTAGDLLMAVPGRAQLEDGDDLGSFSIERPGVAGYGLALDAGVNWTLPMGLTIDAAIHNIGGMFWRNSLKLAPDAETIVDTRICEYDEYGECTEYFPNPDKDAAIEDIQDGLANFRGAVDYNNMFAMTPLTVSVGARYRMPFYSGLSVGLFGTSRFGSLPYSDFRLGLGFSPARIFSLSGTAGFTSFGPAFGSAINFHFGPFNLYGGVDKIYVNYTNMSVPKGRLDLVAKFGLMITVG